MTESADSATKPDRHLNEDEDEIDAEKSGEPKDDDNDGEEEEDMEERSKPRKAGIVYLSTIPPRMNVQLLREALQSYGDIGRIYLQAEEAGAKKSRRRFTEGWVEFKRKHDAKQVAIHLNNQKVGGKRRSPAYETLWNIKYLSGFKWAHLNERLAYEKAVHQQRMRTEIAQVKRETDFFIESVDKSRRLRRKMGTLRDRSVAQKPTEEEVLQRKRQSANDKKKNNPEERTRFLQNLFNPAD